MSWTILPLSFYHVPHDKPYGQQHHSQERLEGECHLCEVDLIPLTEAVALPSPTRTGQVFLPVMGQLLTLQQGELQAEVPRGPTPWGSQQLSYPEDLHQRIQLDHISFLSNIGNGSVYGRSLVCVQGSPYRSPPCP